MQPTKINFVVPQGWHELTEDQLRFVFGQIAADATTDELKTICLLRWSGAEVVGRQPKGAYLLQHADTLFEVSPLAIAEAAMNLDWLGSLPPMPKRLEKINSHAALAADFLGVPFETYIVVENLYQGFLSTQKDALLDDLAHVLYPGCSATLTSEERISIFYWVASLKDMFARRFPDFFQPATANAENLLGSSPNIGKQLQESMDAQIRALTKGDITKEKEILSLDTWRALTELNAQAKEYKQINAQINAKK